MILKKSYLVDLRENMKQRAWVFWSVFLIFFCYYPGFLMINLNRITQQGEFLSQEDILKRVDELLVFWFDVNYLNVFMVTFMAVVIGIQSFHYLYDKKQVNFFHSQPVARKRRFTVLWSNGIYLFLVAYTLNMIAGLLVSHIYVSDHGKYIPMAILSYGLNILLFLCIYHLTLIAVMLTGYVLVSISAVIIFLVYEFAFRAIFYLYCSIFMLTYDEKNAYNVTNTVISPLVLVIDYLRNKKSKSYWNTKGYGSGELALALLLISVIFGIIAFILYKKRPSESYGKSIAFPKIKQPVQVAILFLVGLYAALLFYLASGNSISFAILGALFIIFLGHAVIQIIYDADFKAIRKNLVPTFLVAAATVAFLLVYKYDLIKYDNRFPKESKVEAVGVELVTEGRYYMQWLMEDGTELWGNDYAQHMMRLSDLEPVYHLLNHMENVKETKKHDNREFYHFNVRFFLKNGNIEYRNFYIDYEKNIETLNEIYRMEEYKAVTEQVLEDNFREKYKIFNIVYDNGLNVSGLEEEESITNLLDAYKKDLKASHYGDIFGEIPIGTIRIEGMGLKNTSHTNYWMKPVFPSYRNTIDFLEREGIIPQPKFDSDEVIHKIENITISMTDETMWGGVPYEEMDQYTKKVIYKDKHMIKTILEYGIPRSCIDVVSGPVYTEDKYKISVLKNISGEDKETIRGDVDYIEEVTTYQYVFKEGNVPGFVIEHFDGIQYGDVVEY